MRKNQSSMASAVTLLTALRMFTSGERQYFIFLSPHNIDINFWGNFPNKNCSGGDLNQKYT